MPLLRREFLGRVAAPAIATMAWAGHSRANIRAVAFDAFPILDPRPVSKLVHELYPDKGDDLSNLWRTKQFEYTWLRTLSGRYSDFWQVTDEALAYAAKALKLHLKPDDHD